MLLHKSTWLALGVFLVALTTTGGAAEAQAPLKNPKAAQLNKKKWAVTEGFRSAKFGMDEKQVLRAIAKDFQVSQSKVKRKVHPIEKTTTLNFKVPDLMAVGGTAYIVYILGFKSKKLMQVNVVWGRGVTDKVDGEGVVSAANLLRTHFEKKRYKKEGYAVNKNVNATTMDPFRGRDKKGRMIILRLIVPKTREGENKNDSTNKVVLKLSYMLDPDTPDILDITKGKF